MKANIIKNELARKRSDYKFTWRDPKDGKTRFENCDFRPNGERLPLRKPELAAEAELDDKKKFGWKVFPRYSYTVELLESYRVKGERNPRTKFYWSKTFNPHPATGTWEAKGVEISRRFDFWKDLERQLMKHKVADTEADRIREQVAEVIPVVTSKELRTMQTDLEQARKNRYGRIS